VKFEFLRKKYPRFIYQNYSWKISGKNLEIFFDFKISPGIRFRPRVVIKNIDKKQGLKVGERALDNLVFNLGLMEIPSYWKATCSPEIKINCGYLNKEQISWWKDLIIRGMGQFFFENKINFKTPSFLKINAGSKNRVDAIENPVSKNPAAAGFFDILKYVKNREIGVLLPLGGGKDSVVTLELLKRAKKNIRCFSLNPTDSAKKIMKAANCRNPIIAERKIDKKLLELNRRGYLNGHTPFSAYLAFLSVLIAALSNQKYIALSNERSSNEGNVKYLGKIINHQWSKSFEFEQKFRRYSKKYLAPHQKNGAGVEYFSFLRPLYEIQIAKIFSRFAKYFPVFLSCNEAYKTASGTKSPTKKWCGKCSKCLFVFAILYPFVKEKQLLKIFSKNLFEDKSLLPIMQQLTGERGFKPFECVGTRKESSAAFYLSWKKYRGQTSAKLPILLRYFEEKILPKYPNLKENSKKILDVWNKQNNLPKKYESCINQNL